MKKLRQVLMAAVICGILVLSSVLLYSEYKKAVTENSRLKTNLEYYQSKFNDSELSNIVLRHTVTELSLSKDSLIQKIDSLKKELKLKPKSIKTVVHIETILRDTLRDTIPITPNFTVTVKPNEQTTIEVIRADSLLTVIPDIRNEQTIFVYTEEKYKYKCWFSRLIHFNFKKIRKDKYIIKNSNDLIKTGESRVINVVN